MERLQNLINKLETVYTDEKKQQDKTNQNNENKDNTAEQTV
mgnify:FL=1